jgi:hypothetical protein
MHASIAVAAAALALTLAADHASDPQHHDDLRVAQAMTGGAGSNSTTTAVNPRTEPGSNPRDEAEQAPRTSRDNGTSNPLAGDEQDQARPNTDPRPDGAPAKDGATAPKGAVH